ncbi:hypothetical protein CC78DRAFT_557482 [Lojkania enalia]|uniref:Rhodopsin domain-containing protein n=1 Tax=Lojkania enalia TaxID=147567 RepID=A0A9P4TR72_9PLEO|nr:hypothetical protein CC78DRAFT_557482 [Didymosphaeria enalia]
MASQIDPVQEQAQQDICTGVATALTAVSCIIIVGLRTYSRQVIVRNFGKDDVMMLVALVFTVAYMIDIYILRENGMGFSGANLSLDQMIRSIKITLSIEIIYYASIYCIKVSIFMFYLRIAASQRLERLSKLTIWFLSVFVVICMIVCVTQCIPLHKMWDFTGLVEGRCINTTAFFYFTSSFNIITDIWILALPIKTLMQIQRPKREKAALIFVFGLGVFSCIASIVRLHAIRIYTESADPFYDSVPINLWSMVEVNVGICCASIPSLKALFIRSQRERSRDRMTGYKYHSRDKSGGMVSAKPVGSSQDDGPIASPLKIPRPIHRKESIVDDGRSSQELIFARGTNKLV